MPYNERMFFCFLFLPFIVHPYAGSFLTLQPFLRHRLRYHGGREAIDLVVTSFSASSGSGSQSEASPEQTPEGHMCPPIAEQLPAQLVPRPQSTSAVKLFPMQHVMLTNEEPKLKASSNRSFVDVVLFSEEVRLDCEKKCIVQSHQLSSFL